MTDYVNFDTNNYLNIQGLAGLKNQASSTSASGQREVAQQFESMLVQLLLKSMRDANKAFTNTDESAAGHEMYQDLFDKQVALAVGHQGLGFSNSVEKYLQQVSPAVDVAKPVNHPEQALALPRHEATEYPASPAENSDKPAVSQFSSELEFVKSLWTEAKSAANQLGLDPKLLLAQAALETGWGKHIITHQTDGSSHNLFNIKAGGVWDKKTVVRDALEERDGVMTKEKSMFRAYTSYSESFNDYVSFIKSNPRYQHALAHAADSETYIKKLQEANYATDTSYSDKVLEIYKGERFNHLVAEAQLT